MQKTTFKVWAFRSQVDERLAHSTHANPTVAVKANQCMTYCRVGACRRSPATARTHHQQMELCWWGWSEGLQMEDAVNVLSQGHSSRPLLQLRFSASLQTSPVVFFCDLTSPAAMQMAPLSTTFTHTRTGGWSGEVTSIISGDNWRKEQGIMPTSLASRGALSV